MVRTNRNNIVGHGGKAAPTSFASRHLHRRYDFNGTPEQNRAVRAALRPPLGTHTLTQIPACAAKALDADPSQRQMFSAQERLRSLTLYDRAFFLLRRTCWV